MRVLCIGECMLEYHRSAEAEKRAIGGDTFNTAVSMYNFGVATDYLTRIGSDDQAESLMQQMSATGVQLVGDFNSDAKNGSYIIHLDTQGERTFTYDRQDSAASTMSARDLSRIDLKNYDLVYSSGITLALSEGCRELVVEIFQKAHEQRIPTAFDINYRSNLIDKSTAQSNFEAVAPHINYLFTGKDEIEIAGQDLDFIEHVITKDGENGAQLRIHNRSEFITCRAFPVQTVDTTGAGDVFNGVYLAGLLNRRQHYEAMRIAAVAAALQVSRRGSVAAIPNQKEVMDLLSSTSAEFFE